LHDQPQGFIVGIGVFEGLPGPEVQYCRLQETHGPLKGALILLGPQLGLTYHGKPAGLVEQLAHGDVRRSLGIGHAEPGKVLLNRRVEFNRAGLHQLHHGECRDGFGDGPDHERSVRRHRTPG
jgi:hypothetical protein